MHIFELRSLLGFLCRKRVLACSRSGLFNFRLLFAPANCLEIVSQIRDFRGDCLNFWSFLKRKKVYCQDFSGKEKSDRFETKSSKIQNSDFYSFVSKSTINVCANGQHWCPFLFGKNERYPGESVFNIKQGNLELFVGQRNITYCRIPPRSPQQRSRFSITDSRCMLVEVKSGTVSKNLRPRRDTGHIPFASRKNRQVPRYIFWKLHP